MAFSGSSLKFWLSPNIFKTELEDAQFALGNMYVIGDGIEQSNSKAREWWTNAAAQGHENAITNLKILDEREGLKSTTTPPPEVVDANIISCSTCGKQ